MRGGLTSRTVVASAVLAVIVGASFVFSLVAIAAERDWERKASGSLEELALLNDLERLVIDLETGLRGFVITHEERFLEPWEEARAALPGRAEDLGRLTDDPVQQPLARRIAADAESYIDDYTVPLVAAARRGDPAASSVAATEEGKERVDAIRADFERYRAAEEAPLAERRDRATDAARLAVLTAAGGLAGSVLLIVLFALYISRAIVVPVRRAAAMAGSVAGGDLTARMPEGAIAEIGSLERSFNSMARSLEANRDDLRLLADEQAALRRVATLVARGVSPSDVFDAVAAEVGNLLAADPTRLLRYEADGTATVVAAHDRPGDHMPVGARLTLEGDNLVAEVLATGRAAGTDLDEGASGSIATHMREMGVRSAVGAPIVVEDRLWGVVLVAWSRQVTPGADVQSRVAAFTELVATAIANAESRAELDASRARVVAASDESRRRIERDLHDGTQQRLVSIGLELRAAQAMAGPEPSDLTERLSQVARGLAAAVTELQEVSRGIHPAILSRGGLGPAVRTLARRSAVPVELELDADRRLPEGIEVAVYYVVSEALTNAAKHAHASVVHIELDAEDAAVRLSIRDDGVGGADPTRGSGLVGLRDRIEALGGKIELGSPAGGGTSLVARLPVDHSQQAQG